ncbi:ABC transporter ATP-binding protein [uncultured Megasphaera sp.]|uniref:ABC transporter ATP-binding protein n=1 Tax=uncultured Megasphaera sp. TaxID=165188 RepID=UPI002638DFBF|nr:ABC transporter ATP-binding protein [uncultured Megasphaera sp.]
MTESTPSASTEWERTRDHRHTARRFIHSLETQKVRLTLVLICIAAFSILNVTAPFYSARVVDTLWDHIKTAQAAGTSFTITWETGGSLIVKLLAIYAASSFFYISQTFLMAGFAEKLNYQFRQEIAEKLQRLPLSFYDTHAIGEVMSYTTNDLNKVSEALQTGLIRLFIAIGTIIGSLFFMFWFSPILTFIFLAFTTISLLVTRSVSQRTLQYAAQRQHLVGALNGIIEESYTGRSVIKAFHYEKPSAQKVHDAAESLAQASAKTDFMINAVNPGIRLINRISLVSIATIGGSMLLSGTLTPGIFQAFFQYVNEAGEPITEFSYMITSLQSALASMERVYQFLDEPEMAPDPKSPLRLASVQGRVAFTHVRFGYRPGTPLMTDVNFTAEPGQKIAIVGSTGAGKTTMVNLLMRFYDPQGGQITIDDVPITAMTRSTLHHILGMVLQDTWLFEGTIAQNIAYGKPNATIEEIRSAAQAARADFFIRSLPQGYHTLLMHNAENLSAGQRQLLTIARVFLRNPSILLLDEATSSIDTHTESEISQALKTLMQGRTSFIIAHRLSTIVDADTILVMQKGNIIEQGSHQELLAAGGAYAALYNSQFA